MTTRASLAKALVSTFFAASMTMLASGSASAGAVDKLFPDNRGHRRYLLIIKVAPGSSELCSLAESNAPSGYFSLQRSTS